MEITICAIAGNTEKYINRFLDWAFKVTPNVVIVRACGNLKSDDTVSIAEKRGCNVWFYENFQDWPHVDDFAAARNLSFSLARTEWVMWADMDDTMDDESIAVLKRHLETAADVDAIEFPYHVPEDGLAVFRERVVKRSCCKWVSPIHEYLQFQEGARLGRITDCKLLHEPIGKRKENDERNLRILENIPPEERTKSHRFHLFQSLRACGRTDEAISECVSMLKDHSAGIGAAERYELFIAAGQLADDTGTRANMMIQALATDPGRREAYGEMALCMLALGKPDHALSYTTAMRALRMPPDAAWNARRKYYGWLGEGLHGMALRANGRNEEADATERNHFIRNGAKISMIHATRGRVAQAVKCRRAWLEMASNPDAVEHIFALDIDDNESYALTVHNFVMMPAGLGPVAAWNAAAEKSVGAVLVQLSDDWEPVPGWDRAILEAIGDTSAEAVLAVSDGARKDDLLCMAILTRARYKRQGHMFHPDFWSVYSDDWFTHCAHRDGVVIDARDRITFEHLHPAFGKAEMDETYARSNAAEFYQYGAKTLERLRAEQ